MRDRTAGWAGDAAQAATEADHLHNLPELLQRLDHEGLHAYYWDAMRLSYLGASKPEYAQWFSALWTELDAANREARATHVATGRAMRSAREWKDFYTRERAMLGETGLRELLDRAPGVELPERGALVFPHTRLTQSGRLVAAVADAVVRSGREEVVALGVLHGARERDADLVARARAGETEAVASLRRVHGPGAVDDAGHWCEEFSLDGFVALLRLAARCAGRAPPRVVARFPFVVGDHPCDLTGLDELRELVARGAVLVATADPIHHGHGYGTLPDRCRPREDAATMAFVRSSIEEGFGLLTRGDFAAFLRHAAEARSDFRDAGPVLAELLRDGAGEITARVEDIALVDYSDVLGAPEPTWVAGALATFARA